MSVKKVLIVCSHFWPSIGGVEISMAQLGSELIGAGYAVTALTPAWAGRSADHYLGIRIWGVEKPEFAAAIRAAVASGDYHACILIQDPKGVIIWAVDGLTPPSSTRLLIQPIINEEGYRRWQDNADFRAKLAAILNTADAALTMTRGGADQRYMREAGVPPVYLPNASAVPASAGDFRQRYGIPADRFLILHVANLHAVKNHIGLIDALPDMPPSWQLVMVGVAGVNGEYVEAVRAKLASRPEIIYIPGLLPEWVGEAMRAADAVVLASHGEGSPITLLEAMSVGTPWLATPECGAANDHLGGVICELAEFPRYLRRYAAQPELARAVGQIGYRHWQECYCWPVVLQGWTDLIEHGALRRAFLPSAPLTAEMDAALERLRANPEADFAAQPQVTPPAPVDFSVFNLNRYRSGPLLVGWVGDAAASQEEVHRLLLPAMGQRHEIHIMSELVNGAPLAHFFNSIDVLLVTGLQSYIFDVIPLAIACGVFPVAIRQRFVAEQLARGDAGVMVDPLGSALHEALNWCAEHPDEVRRRGYRQAQTLALRESGVAAERLPAPL